MDCSTIIVSYNTFEWTRGAVESALHSGASIGHEVIVVDNASPDRSAERLEEEFAGVLDVSILRSGGNIGFAAANNLGATHARGRVLFFLNPDTVVQDDAVPVLTAFLDAHPHVGAAGPHVLNEDGTDQASVLTFMTAGELVRQYLPIADALRGRDRRTDSVPAQSGPVDAVKGCALAVRRSAFDAVGGWDESYFMYAEEVELCWQLAERGLSTVFLRDATIVHFGGVASRDRYVEQQVMDRRSALQFLRRHGEPGVVSLNRVAGAVGFGVRAPAFAALARLRPGKAADYRLRGQAASALWRWFLFSYD